MSDKRKAKRNRKSGRHHRGRWFRGLAPVVCIGMSMVLAVVATAGLLLLIGNVI